MKAKHLVRSVVMMGCLALAGWSCSSDDDDTTAPVVVPPAATFDISQRSTEKGTVLVDQKGKTLYFFTKDANGTSACTGGCLAAWPIFSVAAPKLDTGLVAADFGSITRADGKTQVTFKGWPLYYYAPDAVAGDVKGENVDNVWIVAKKSYSIMLANTQLVGNDGKNYTADGKEGTGDTQYFVDAAGRTLYAFAKDKKNKNNYTKADFSNDATWPIWVTDWKDVPSALDKSLFSTIDVFGKKQMTYKGWPMYYFGPDNATRGLTKGVSVPSPGVWPIIQKTTVEAPE
jgi:predicted lipoprotein with Yx(FWY)xxD motif